MNEKPVANWEDIEHDGTLAGFSKRNGLVAEHLDIVKGVLILPRNSSLVDYPSEINLFPAGTKELKYAFINAGLDASMYSDDREKRDLLLKTADIVLPVLLFVGGAAVTVGLNILSNWIYDRFVRARDIDEPQIKVEYVEIDENKNIVKWRRIEAPASKLYLKLLNEVGFVSDTEIKSPLEIDEGKHDGDWVIQCKNEAKAARDVADELLEETKIFIDKQDLKSAERISRRTLQKLREAYLWEPHVIDHIKYLHKIGKFIHDHFMCLLEYKDGSYWVTCPVLLSHCKGGFSIGGSGRTICSICGKEMIDCPHLKGNQYDNVVAFRQGGLCNICGKRECSHNEGEAYNGVRAFGIVVVISLDHVSLVEKPANPLCVVQRYSLSENELMQNLPEEERTKIIHGETPINCHHCLVCNGSAVSNESMSKLS